MTPQPKSDLDRSPISKDFSGNSSHLLVAFGGYFGGIGVPPFEFSNVSEGADVKKMYVRDFRRAVYHAGLPGLSKDIPSTAKVLQKLIAESQAETVTFIGNSQGGFAAILLGPMLDVNYVHAFSAQTFADPWNRWKYGEKRWPHVALQLYVRSLFKKKYYDLRKVLGSLKYKTRIHLHYGLKDPMEKVNAEHLQGVPGVTLHAYPLGKRALLKHMIDSGLFDKILHGTPL